MLEVTIDSKQVSEFLPRNDRDITLGRENAEAKGIAFTAEAANARFRSEKVTKLFGRSVFMAFIFLIGLVMSPPKNTTGLWLWTIFFLISVFGPSSDDAFDWYRWSKSLPERVRMALLPGTPVRLDDEGLGIGDSFAAWGDIAVERVDLVKRGVRIISYDVRAVALRAPGFFFLLDSTLLENGQAIVDEIYRRKCRVVLRGQ